MRARITLIIALTLACFQPQRLKHRKRPAGIARRCDRPHTPRLSFVDGQVSFFRSGAQDWVQAQVNTPLLPATSSTPGPGEPGAPDRRPRLRARLGQHSDRIGKPGARLPSIQGNGRSCFV